MKTPLKLLAAVLLLTLPVMAQAQFVLTTNADNTLNIVVYVGTNEVVTIPDSTNGMKVTSVGSFAFYQNTIVTSISIPNSVISIGFATFDGCLGLTRVTIGKGVVHIASFPFDPCPNLKEIFFLGNAPTVQFGLVPQVNPTVYYLPRTTGWGFFSSQFVTPTVLWNPQASTDDGNFGVQTNQFGFTITGSPNLDIVVEACTNLAGGGWFPLATNTLNTIVGTNGTSYFSDPQWTNFPARLYRFRSP